jgi:hyperosmotically inducible protein
MSFHDLTLTAKVKAALVQAEDVSARDIDVDAHEGVIDLKGNVSQHEHDRAIEVAKSVDGVSGVEDHLTIKSHM